MKQLLVTLCLFQASLLPTLASTHKLQILHAESAITFEARATMHGFTGAAERWTLEVEAPDGGALPAAARLVLELEALKTGNASRDKEMLHWMDHADHPRIEFVLTGIVSLPSGYTATGDLSLHGVSRPISFPISIAREERKWILTGTVAIDHREYGLKQFRKLGFLSVSPRVEVSFRIVGVSP